MYTGKCLPYIMKSTKIISLPKITTLLLIYDTPCTEGTHFFLYSYQAPFIKIELSNFTLLGALFSRRDASHQFLQKRCMSSDSNVTKRASFLAVEKLKTLRSCIVHKTGIESRRIGNC